MKKSSAAPPEPEPQPGPPPASPERRAAVVRAMEEWMERLVEPGPDDGLLRLASADGESLDLGAPPGAALMRLFAGEPVAVAELLGEATAPERAEAFERLHAIERRAVLDFEERGIWTMCLVHGIASWVPADGGGRPAAPVVLLAVRLEPAAGGPRLVRSGDAELNLALLSSLTRVFGCDFAQGPSAGQLDGSDAADLAAAMDWILLEIQRIAAGVPGFEIRRTAAAANLSLHRLATIRDLQQAGDRLAACDLTAAMAGDPETRAALQARRIQDQPERADAGMELGVLDADADQRAVISRVLAGTSGVITGAPGTGTSQTIANLAAELAAAGRPVLLLAEKRAALESVRGLLAGCGLEHLLLDLHGALDTRDVMARLRESLEMVDAGRPHEPLPDAQLDPEPASLRRTLDAHRARMHTPVAPCGLTVFELQSSLLALPPEVRGVFRWREPELTAVISPNIHDLRDLMVRCQALADLLMGTGSAPWVGAVVSRPQDARAALDAAGALSGRLSELSSALDAVIAEVGLQRPSTIAETVELAEALERAADLRRAYDANLFGLDLDSLERRLQAGVLERRGSAFREARRQLLSLRRGTAPRGELVADVRAARALAALWRWHGNSGAPAGSASLPRLRAVLDGVLPLLSPLDAVLRRGPLEKLPLAELAELAAGLAPDPDTALRLPLALELSARMNDCGGGGLLGEILDRRLPPAVWPLAVDHAWWASCLDLAREADPGLAGFDGRLQDRAVEEFTRLDRRRLSLAAERVRQAHLRRAAESIGADAHAAALVRDQAARAGGHLALGSLMASAGEVVTALRPCWLASPLAVSRLMDGGRPYFDVVIIDHGARVLSQDAVSAIIRGRTTVVAGDPKQLPPRPPAEGGPAESVLESLASVLDVWPLGTHYSSRDERLIAFSNRRVYGGSLLTFPAAIAGPPVRLVRPAPGEAEAEVVARVLAELAAGGPRESLGVVAVTADQAARLELALELARGGDRDLDSLLGAAPGLFVKEVSRAQGERRDRVVLVIGHPGANGADGRVAASLLGAAAEGLVNVAATRANRELVVVSPFGPGEVDAGPLRDYLAFVEAGGTVDGGPVEAGGFERQVLEALRARGIDVVPRHGLSRLPIDLVARHPQDPRLPVLAIECDGAGYGSIPAARERDRVRREQLESRGWVHCRIWSTDWFLRPAEEVERVVAAYRSAVARVGGLPDPASELVPGPSAR